MPGDSLDRFVSAQRESYDDALAELRAGTKRSHWMWFVFPQIAGLGRSPTARLYGIANRAEAEAFCRHEVLGSRLREATEAMLGWAGQRSATAILGTVDAMKFRSSMTLFEATAPDPAPFAAAVDAFYGGERDAATLTLLGG